MQTKQVRISKTVSKPATPTLLFTAFVLQQDLFLLDGSTEQSSHGQRVHALLQPRVDHAESPEKKKKNLSQILLN